MSEEASLSTIYGPIIKHVHRNEILCVSYHKYIALITRKPGLPILIPRKFKSEKGEVFFLAGEGKRIGLCDVQRYR